MREGLLKQGSVRAAGLLHNSPQLNGDALEPKSDSTQIQPHDAVTRQKRQTVATRNLNRNHRSAAHLCKLAACRASGEIGTDALAVSPIRPLSHLSSRDFVFQPRLPSARPLRKTDAQDRGASTATAPQIMPVRAPVMWSEGITSPSSDSHPRVSCPDSIFESCARVRCYQRAGGSRHWMALIT